LNKTFRYVGKAGRLKKMLQKMGSILVAYSGGVDSTFLLKASVDALGDRALAVIAESETYPEREVKEAVRTAKRMNDAFLVIETEEIKDKKFIRNNKDRCYWCKQELFSRMKLIAKKRNISFIADGTNYDDLSDFRPGSKAADELNIKRPLAELKFTKDGIRKLSKKMSLPNWDKPSFACLASRIPYKTKISKQDLANIDKAENYIMKLGIGQVRVRHQGQIARIEVFKADIPRVIKNRGRIVQYLKKLGYLFITLDLEGYKTGNMNKLLKNNKG